MFIEKIGHLKLSVLSDFVQLKEIVLNDFQGRQFDEMTVNAKNFAFEKPLKFSEILGKDLKVSYITQAGDFNKEYDEHLYYSISPDGKVSLLHTVTQKGKCMAASCFSPDVVLSTLLGKDGVDIICTTKLHKVIFDLFWEIMEVIKMHMQRRTLQRVSAKFEAMHQIQSGVTIH